MVQATKVTRVKTKSKIKKYLRTLVLIENPTKSQYSFPFSLLFCIFYLYCVGNIFHLALIRLNKQIYIIYRHIFIRFIALGY